ncbi:hypothetical protein OIU78_004368, partial [Salix suchowensis]
MQFVLGCFSVGFLWTPRLRESLKKIFHVFKILKSILLWYLFYLVLLFTLFGVEICVLSNIIVFAY